MPAVVQWLRMTAACPAPHSTSCTSASRKARRKARLQQPPAQHAQQQAQQAQHAQQPAQQAQQAQQATEQMSASSAPHQVIESQPAAASAEPPVRPDVSAGVQSGATLHEPVSVTRHSLVPEPATQRDRQVIAPQAAAAAPAAPTAADAAAGPAAAEAKAAPLVPPVSGWRGPPQQEWGFMDTLAQLRSIMFEDIAVNSSEELPAAGEPCFCICVVDAKKAWQIQCGRCAIIMMKI